MPDESVAAATLASLPASDGPSSVVFYAAVVCLIWYVAVTLVSTLGYVQVRRYFSSPPPSPEIAWSQDAPHVNIIRPIKGLEPSLYDCLASTFRQGYPRDKLHIRFCISDRDDPAVLVLERLLRDFPSFDTQILVEDEDLALQDGTLQLGPNPKIRNMSRAYREAIGDFIWIIDCNVWVAKGVCGRLVGKLEGRGEKRKNKFVHQLPLVIDTVGTTTREETTGLLDDSSSQIRTSSSASHSLLSRQDGQRTASSIGGGRLEELFLSSAHAKFYTAINTVLIAPCIVGKSTMFRRRHLDSLTDGAGINHFSENICEDHLIGDLLWKQNVPEEIDGESWGKHACCFGDLAVQPMANMSVVEYWRRRVRWLRVRKYTVTLATLVEPGTESFLCSLYGAFAVTTLPFFESRLGISPTWSTFAIFWLCSVSAWCLMDWTLYLLLHSGRSIEVDDDTPAFARPPKGGQRRPFAEWLFAWLGRESLAFPIWFWAIYGGAKVEWRGKEFWVGMDMKVHELKRDGNDEGVEGLAQNGHASRSSSRNKDRVD